MPPEASGGRRRRVVIVGGGFGGLAAARRLRGADVDVTLIDRRNHHLFQPLLYQVAAGVAGAGRLRPPIRTALRRNPNATVLMAEVVDVDPEAREVVLDRGERIGYDSLIVACGAETSYFGNDDWADVTCGLKTLDDAVDLRNRIFGAFEQAERDTDPESRGGVADLRGRRRRADRRGGRRRARDHGEAVARRRLLPHRARRRAGDPARRRRTAC